MEVLHRKFYKGSVLTPIADILTGRGEGVHYHGGAIQVTIRIYV
jgi:hypothetical protein